MKPKIRRRHGSKLGRGVYFADDPARSNAPPRAAPARARVSSRGGPFWADTSTESLTPIVYSSSFDH